MMTPIPLAPTILDAPVEGRHLRPGTLRDQLGDEPTLVVFLRHLGCLFTREWIDEIQSSGETGSTSPAMLYVHLGTKAQGDAFFEPRAAEARAIADPDRVLSKAFGVPKASPLQLLDPRVWACGFRATRQGHKSGMPVGDPLVMPALFLVEGGRVTWKFIPDHMGGRPRLDQIPRPEMA